MHPTRLHPLNQAPLRDSGSYVLYWMVASRRLGWNHALDHAAALAREHGVPLLVFEPLRVGYLWASDRHHAFVLEGMVDNQRQAEAAGITYFPWVEREPGQGSGLLEALAARATAVVTDFWPCFFLPRMQTAVAERLEVRLDAVDGNGLYPLGATDRTFTVAHSFRRHLQKELRPFLEDPPAADPLGHDLAGAEVPEAVRERWPATDPAALREDLASLPIDHAVPPIAERGGRVRGLEVLERFLDERLGCYDEGRRDVVDEKSSGLSPWLHFGHVGAWEVFRALADREGWSPARLGKPNGKREGWWGMSEAAESFLDELVTWRELAFNGTLNIADYDRFESLPDWARETLNLHASDERQVYDLETLEEARTDDPVWNAAQNQLRVEGRIHNYLRMLWGKKVLQWSPTPEVAMQRLVHLNNRWAVDGRDPNSYSGIAWVLGRYDRAWGPERPIFGKVRYMTSDATRKKVQLDRYLARFGELEQGQLF